MKTDAHALLRAYANQGSEAAFGELVSRYVDLVHSVAFRRVSGDMHLAEDIVQTVFADLARKAASLPSDVKLGGWLHRHTCFVASNFLRGEFRRRSREQETVAMDYSSNSTNDDWEQLAPVLDEAIDQLAPVDRDAIILRYFEQCDLRAVGTVLGASEDAAQKRVSRALDKLRTLLVERGVTLSLAALASALAGQGVFAGPVGLEARASRSALSAVSGAGFLAALLKLIPSAGAKFAIVVAGVVTVIGILVFNSRQATTDSPRPAELANAEVLATMDRIAPGVAALPATPSEPTAPIQTPVEKRNVLRLTIVSADSDRPVPNVPIDYRGWEDAKFTDRKLHANRAGICDITFPLETITELELITRVDDFADTRLKWVPKRGDRIPSQYTLRLDRPVRIGGRVLDADGQPVAGAKVGFSHGQEPVSSKAPESHEFRGIEVESDADGRWSINRIAPDMLRRIYGHARHPEHVTSELVFLEQTPSLETPLREGTHVFRLGQAISINGVVADAEARPVAGAEVFVGEVGTERRRKAATAFDGAFTVAGCKPGTNVLSAVAEGFAATALEVNATANAEPVLLTLHAGKTLRIRVADRAGQPIANATVRLNTFKRSSPTIDSPQTIPAQVEFNPKTDTEGRVKWNNAPDGEHFFIISAGGYMVAQDVRLRPDAVEHVVTLSPALTVFGTARDAENGELIPQFRVVTGWPDWSLIPGTTNARWSMLEPFWPRFSGGQFRHTYEEPVVGGMANRGYILKFEAEGYAPFISRIIGADEVEARIDAVLHPAASTTITVLLPDGRPASQVDVGLVSPGARLELLPGRFSRLGPLSGAALLRTDAKGKVLLSSDPSITRVIFACSDGYAEAMPADLRVEPTVRLQPWGRIEGVFASGKSAAGRLVKLELGHDAFDTVRTDFHQYQLEADGEGRFTFPQVPPGQRKLLRLFPGKQGNMAMWRHGPTTDIDIQPGETTRTTLGEPGCIIIARVLWPEGFKRAPTMQVFGTVATPLPEPPADGIGSDDVGHMEALVRLQKSPEFLVAAASARRYPFTEQPDGTWRSEEVLPGNYTVSVRVAVFPAAEGGMAPYKYMEGMAPVTVPAEPVTGALDIGEIVVRMVKAPLPHGKSE
jgi:RNA polymerase sigma factor (sigma-70 family)